MEEAIRRLVKEEVRNAIGKVDCPTEEKRPATAETESSAINKRPTVQTRPGSSSSSTSASGSSSSHAQSFKKKEKRNDSVSSRLTTLLTKINKKKSTNPKKPLRLQVRWVRVSDGVQKKVKQEEGGGHRFVEMDGESLLSELYHKCIEIFFTESGCNYFGEYKDEMENDLLDMTENLVDLSDSVNSYLKNKGLFPSKCYFILKTYPSRQLSSPYKESENCPDTDSDLEEILEQPTLRLKRKICDQCSSTYVDFCLICKQNERFEEALALDRSKDIARTNIENKENNENSDDNSVQATINAAPNHDFLRQKRVEAFASTTKKDVQKVLTDLSTQYKSINEDKSITFTIRRRHIFKDVISKMKTFFENNIPALLNVQFFSFGSLESAIDTGGPGRELASLFLEEASFTIFQGPEKQKTFLHDIEKVNDNVFLNFGKFVAISILHGYDIPKYFCRGLSSYIVGLKVCNCDYEDVPDIEIKNMLSEINNSVDSEAFTSIISRFDQRFEMGCNAFRPKFEEKSQLVKSIAHHCIISSNLEEIQQFMDGLAFQNVLDHLKSSPHESMQLFMYDEKIVDLEKVKKMFKPNFSTENEVLVAEEEDIVYNFFDFIDKLGTGKNFTTTVVSYKDLEDGKISDAREVTKRITLSDLLEFLTGSKYVTSQMFDIYFTHGNKGRITVSTCNKEIRFPVRKRYFGEEFEKNFVEDICGSVGFGRV